jgi:hypothetical protein
MSFVDPAEIREHLKGQVVHGPARKRISATPFVFRDPASIPPRDAVYGRHFVRKYISATVAAGRTPWSRPWRWRAAETYWR